MTNEYIKLVQRKEDMSPDGYLHIQRDADGDIIVAVFEGGSNGGLHQYADCEFTTIGRGGGSSPRTFEALLDLMEAMVEDNRDDTLSETRRGKTKVENNE